MNANGRRTPFFGSTGLSSAAHPWMGFTFEASNSPAVPLPLHSWSQTTLLYVTGGSSSLDWRHRGMWNKDRLQRGTVSIVRRDAEIQSAVPSHSVPIMVLQLDHGKLGHFAADHVLAIDKTLTPVQVTRDVRLATLLSAMFEEVKDGCGSGRLFAESISLALLAYLSGRYATPSPAQTGKKGLSPAQKHSLVAYVRANLAADISVTELAALVHMSPSHFTRMFKMSFGMTPYRFVMHERVQAAKEMVAGSSTSAIEVAMTFGFASQSHFAKVFRQFTGVSPKQYRAGC
jgi:AraC family transcriptional regulator